MASALSIISIVAYILAGVFLITAVVLWIVFKIPRVAGDLSGKTARRSIELLRTTNEKTGKKSFATSQTNLERGKLTSTMQHERVQPDKAEPIGGTGMMPENKASGYTGEETVALNVASFEEGTVALETGNETVALESPYASNPEWESESETTTLNEDSPFQSDAQSVQIQMLDETIFVHTNDVISTH